jgi:tripartite-type tricarboxylate transporter receptor subunit TctC
MTHAHKKSLGRRERQHPERGDAMKAKFIVTVLLASFVMPTGIASAADDFPNKMLRAVTSQGPGGLSDIFMRGLADELGPALGQTIVVENRVGAAGTIGARACADAAPDGYTFCILPDTAAVYNPIIFPNQNFDPKERLTPITRLYDLTQVLAVTGALNVKSLDELIKHTKAHPKTMNYMAPSLAKVAFMNELNKKNGTDFIRVPFKGGGDAVNNMMTGTTPIAIFGIGNLVQLMRSGKIVGLAVDGDKRSPLAPNIPTFKEAGYTKYLAPSFFGIYAPAGTPKPIIDKLHAAIVKVASNPEFQKRHMENRGLTAVLNTPEQFAKELVTERAEGLAAIKASGLYPNIT